METKQQVHNLIILDESGSMESIKKQIIQGFNEIVQTVKGISLQFPEQEHFISLVSFNGLGSKILHLIDPVEKLETIDAKRYNPDASTPLFDAMGFAINKLNQLIEGKPNCRVLVTIMTDGEENASTEYNGKAIKSLVDELKQNGWTFTYIGADHDVEKIAMSISITNTLVFEKDEASMKNMFEKEKSARLRFSKNLMANEEINGNYYKEDK